MIVAVDPGGTTGFVYGERVKLAEFDVLGARELPWVDRFWLFDFIVAQADRIDRIVIERFVLYNDPLRLRSQIGSHMPSSQIIGIVECAANLVGLLNKVTYQGAADRLMIKRIPKHHRLLLPRSNHVEDAYRHLAYFFIINKRVPEL